VNYAREHRQLDRKLLLLWLLNAPVGVCAIIIGLYGLGGWWLDEIPAIAAMHILALALPIICVVAWFASIHAGQSDRPLIASRLLMVPPSFLLLFIAGFNFLSVAR
jgi:hypothetical protein